MFSDSSADRDGPALSDEQTRAQVVEPARQLVQSAGLQLRAANFRFDACTDQGVAPFRGLVELGFTFPAGIDKQAYLDQIVAAMTANGWSQGAPSGKQPHGRALHQGELMAIIAANPDHPDRGHVDIYGECRNPTAHDEDDSTGRQDISAELTD